MELLQSPRGKVTLELDGNTGNSFKEHLEMSLQHWEGQVGRVGASGKTAKEVRACAWFILVPALNAIDR